MRQSIKHQPFNSGLNLVASRFKQKHHSFQNNSIQGANPDNARTNFPKMNLKTAAPVQFPPKRSMKEFRYTVATACPLVTLCIKLNQ